MLLNEKELETQLSAGLDDDVRRAYLMLAYAPLPSGITVRPASHGFISRELRFEANGRWLYSAVLNQKWILWYFRRPAFNAGLVQMAQTATRFPASEETSSGDIKLRLRTEQDAKSILEWIGSPHRV